MQQRKDGAVSTGRVHMGIRHSGDAHRQAGLDCPAFGDWSLLGWTAWELWWGPELRARVEMNATVRVDWLGAWLGGQ